jgi:hypothetical protein
LGEVDDGKVGPPDLSSPISSIAARSLPGVFVERSQLGAVERSVQFRVCARIDFVQAFRDGIRLLPVEEFGDRRCI